MEGTFKEGHLVQLPDHFRANQKLNHIVEATTEDLDRLESWACVNLLEFYKAKCKVLQLGQGNPKHKYRLGRGWNESSREEKELGLLADELKAGLIKKLEKDFLPGPVMTLQGAMVLK